MVERYRTPSDARAWGQLASCVFPLIGVWIAMLWSIDVSYALTLAIAVPGCLVFVRLFMLQHDMGHGALFKTPWLNDVVGILICVPLLTPYWEWRKSHALHHGNTARLETRIVPDIYTMTTAEWAAASTAKRLAYRVFRSVPFLMGVAPSWHFLISNRIKGSMCKGLPRGKNLVNVHLTTLLYVAFAFTVSHFVGFEQFVLVQAPLLLMGGAVGIWTFVMEHNHRTTWLSTAATWTHEQAALRGSSFCTMGPIARWALADVGYHHIHHLDARIPNYRLKACHDENPQLFGNVPSFTIWQTLEDLWSLRLYDEQQERLVPFP